MIRRPPRSPLFPSTTLFGAARQVRLLDDAALPLPGQDVARLDPIRRDRRAVLAGEDQTLVLGYLDHLVDLVAPRSEEHTSEFQSRQYLVCRLLLEKKIVFFT